ncbi:MAG: hypothetical protein RIK87_05720 [Fuerstiella sp.]
MVREHWNRLHEWLNAFQTALSTHDIARLVDLHVDFVDDQIVVSGYSQTYYALQLTLQAINAFMIESPPWHEITLQFLVNGREISMRIGDEATSRPEPHWPIICLTSH